LYDYTTNTNKIENKAVYIVVIVTVVVVVVVVVVAAIVVVFKKSAYINKLQVSIAVTF
jgi:flagellar basal body-associated protein FliL